MVFNRPTSPTFKRYKRTKHVCIRNFDDYTAMVDSYDGIQELPNVLPGCPNFRRVPGYQIYCTGQPSVGGFDGAINKMFEGALSKVWDETYPRRDSKIVWLNTRQEPILYVNGDFPICARPQEKIGKDIELANVTKEAIVRDEKEFLKICQNRIQENGGKLKYFTVDHEEKEIEVTEIFTLETMVEMVREKFPGFVHYRVPVPQNSAPQETDYDIVTSSLVGTEFNTPIIVTDQVGKSRATSMAVIACIFKEFQVAASYDGIVTTVPGVDTTVLKFDKYEDDMAKDPMMRGEFNVINKLMDKLEGSKDAKKMLDKIIDSNSRGGLIQLREEIAVNKLNYELVDDKEQVVLKKKIKDNVQRYFYSIVFTTYMRGEVESAKDSSNDENFNLKNGKKAIPTDYLTVGRTFASYMQDHDNLRSLIESGKGDLKWERDIPPEALAKLESLAKDDFILNLSVLIYEIFELAHSIYSDMPKGTAKKRATYRFASKTLMLLLPAEDKSEISKLISKGILEMDLYDILGFVTWKYQED